MALGRIGFLHVPKAAGTSTTFAMKRALWDPNPLGKDMDRSLYGRFDRFDEMPATTQKRFYLGDGTDLHGRVMLLGHFSRRTLCATLRPAQVMTIFREPRVRLLSHYLFWRSFSAEQHEAFLPWDLPLLASTLTFEEFLAQPVLAPQIDNVCTRMLLVPHRCIPVERFLSTTSALNQRLVLAHARRWALRLGVMVPLEVGDRLGPILSEWSGLDVQLDHLNRTERAETVDVDAMLTTRARDLLAERTQLDRVLFRLACSKHGLDPDATESDTFEQYLDAMRGERQQRGSTD